MVVYDEGSIDGRSEAGACSGGHATDQRRDHRAAERRASRVPEPPRAREGDSGGRGGSQRTRNRQCRRAAQTTRPRPRRGPVQGCLVSAPAHPQEESPGPACCCRRTAHPKRGPSTPSPTARGAIWTGRRSVSTCPDGQSGRRRPGLGAAADGPYHGPSRPVDRRTRPEQLTRVTSAPARPRERRPRWPRRGAADRDPAPPRPRMPGGRPRPRRRRLSGPPRR